MKENPSTFVGPLFNKDKSNLKTFSNSEYVTPLSFKSMYSDMECEVLPIDFNHSTFSINMDIDTEMDRSEIFKETVEPLFTNSINEIEDLVIVEPLHYERKQEVLQFQSSNSTNSTKEYIPPRLMTTNDLVSPVSFNLNENTTNSFSSQCFSSLEISEFAKELLPIMEIMQKSATNRRSIFLKAIIGSTSLSRQTLLNFEMNLEKYYNWSHTESWTQTTRVYYNNSFTDVIYKNKAILRESFKMDTLFSGTIRLGSLENFKSKRILIDQSLVLKADVDEDCILPNKVDIFQHKLYTKGPFEISLTKMWSAKNIVEAEKLQHDENPKLSVSVKLKSPDFILERNQSNFTVASSLGLFVASCVENLYF
jgi:hypothetical protein